MRACLEHLWFVSCLLGAHNAFSYLQAGMAYFFQTRPNQKTVVARYTNYPLISIPSQNRFFIGAS